MLAAPVTTLVIGSETLERAADFKDIVAEAPGRVVLSLDFRGEEFMGPEALLRDPNLWPTRLIVMTLARVGTGQGPDVARIADVAARGGPGRRIYAAGGIRDRADLEAARQAGAFGALTASALHEGKISAGDLKQIAGRKV